MHYSVSIAEYPESFKGYVVSPTKICLQFNNPECKLRIHDTDREQYPKFGSHSDRMIPIGTLGTKVDCVAVGCQMPVVEAYQFELVDAYRKYARLYSHVYKEQYNKEFKDFLLILQSKINALVAEVAKNGSI